MMRKTQVVKRPKQPVEGLFCNYSHRVCMQNRLDGFDYCVKHILEDKNCPFKQCNYMSNKNGKRCPNAAPKTEKKDGYCAEHARRALLMRQRAHRKRRPRETPETLLEEIEHYGTTRGAGGEGPVEHKRVRPNADSIANRVLDYASSSDSEAEQILVDQAWRGDGDSDAESVDSEQEDLLKHAGVYHAEEVALITRDKLIRLQSLYIDQFKRLQHVLKEKRRKFLHARKLEQETLGSIHAAKEDPEQRDKYEKLVAYKRYHKRFGKEALLHRQSKERRIAVSEGTNYRPPAYAKCIHIEAGSKCMGRTVPLSKFCQEHILRDPHQVLYQPCMFAEGACGRPTMCVTMDEFLCPIHVPLQDPKSLAQMKDEDEGLDQQDCQLPIDVVSEVTELPDVQQPHLEADVRDASSTAGQQDIKTESMDPEPCIPASTSAGSSDLPSPMDVDPVPSTSTSDLPVP